MNLIKAHKKELKRKAKRNQKRLDISRKTGRMKVRVMVEKEHQRKIIEEKQKVESNTTSIPIEVSPTLK